jgi:4-amino-4-deoxy-L-arabinose transferase-like glycosyltransferase
VLALIGVAAGLRLIALAAFPEIQADEGLWTNSAKNFVEFGDWFLDGRTHLFLSPLFSLLSAISFRLLGPSIAAARLISAVAGVAAVALLYATVVRAVRNPQFALLVAVLFGVSEWSVIASREALIEPLQLCLCLWAVYLSLDARLSSVAGAGVVLALALLAKTNAIFLMGVLSANILLRARKGQRLTRARDWASVLILVMLALAIAGVVYAGLYREYPERFAQAFRFELDGVHFERESHPLFHIGRFGLDPIRSGRTLLALFREAPFLMVLAALGAGVWVIRRPPGSAVFALWLALGLPFFFLQIFQPLRYFYLVSPALAFSAALAITEFGRAPSLLRRQVPPLVLVAAGIYVGFALLYLSASAVSNRARLLPAVIPWMTAHTPQDANVMAAGYFCTDLPNRAYAHYHLANTPEQLLESIRKLDIRYLIVDNREWAPSLRAAVEEHFGPPLHTWSFGAVYSTTHGFAPFPEP